MTSKFNDPEQIRFLTAAVRLVNRERISAAEEQWMRGILNDHPEAQLPREGFPEQAVGDAGEGNNLHRTNWFNGRYLTAEALSRQDVYFDLRARLNAHALMPGIAWGLGIAGKRVNQPGGTAFEFTLGRGLAFDGVGRPILVSQDYSFTLAQLIGVSARAPRRVVGGQREFMPCVCLAPDPAGQSGGSGALPSGPYLLVIEPGEAPEGKARVTGDVCGGRRGESCGADAWQSTFGLSLVRFPVDVPLPEGARDVWALRGTLSAYYFDTFEHPLASRWASVFPLDGSFAGGSEPGRHEGMAIPLAVVHLGDANVPLYIDSWIPRRLITATPGEDWHRACFGAPPRAAAWARIHQFQTMLQESLAQRSMAASTTPQKNLYGRGFRHIPPIGFLPVSITPATGGGQVVSTETACTNFMVMVPRISAYPFQGVGALFYVNLPVDKEAGIQRPESTLIGRSPSKTSQQAWSGLVIDAVGQTHTVIKLNQPASLVTIRVHVIKDPLKIPDSVPVDETSVGPKIPEPGSLIEEKMGIKDEVVSQPGLWVEGGKEAVIKRGVPTEKLGESMSWYSLTRSAADSGDDAENRAFARVTAYRKGADKVKIEIAQKLITRVNESEEITFSAAGINEILIENKLVTILEFFEYKYQVDNEIEPCLSVPVGEALRQAEAFFAETNVVLYGTVAFRDDDLLEDLHQAIDKDPIMLAPRDWSTARLFKNWLHDSVGKRKQVFSFLESGSYSLWVFLSQALSEGAGSEIDQLVNREIEVAKLVVPLQGLARQSSPLERMPSHARKEPASWPRDFVLYVKQRMVLLDLLFLVWDNLNQCRLIKNGLTVFAKDKKPITNVCVSDYRTSFEEQSRGNQLLVRSILSQPMVQELVRLTLAETNASFVKPAPASRFLAKVKTVSDQMATSVTDEEERRAFSLARATDAWQAEFQDAELLQILAAVQSPQQTLDFMKQLSVNSAPPANLTVADTWNLDPPSSFDTSFSRQCYGVARQGLVERGVTELLKDLPSADLIGSLTVREVLEMSPLQAAKVLGGADNLKALQDAFLDQRQQALAAARSLRDGYPGEVVSVLETAAQEGISPGEALIRLKGQVPATLSQAGKAELERQLDNTLTLFQVSGKRMDVLRLRSEG